MNDKNINPYITNIIGSSGSYFGILKIRSKDYVSLYCFKDMPQEDIEELLKLAEKWWWQSNRTIPISVFMSEDIVKFEKYCIRFSTQMVEIIGPNISLSDLPSKRIKRRNLTLKKRK